MNRHRSYAGLDDAPVVDGDGGFVGVDERDPAQVGGGYCSEAVNYEFRDGVARPRKGCVPLPWLNGEGLTWPWNFPVSFEYPRPIVATVLAGAVFDDADDHEWLIVAGNPADGGATQVWAMRQGLKPRLVEVPDDMPVLEECSFLQCFNKLLMFRGARYPVLEMADVRTGFADITQVDSTTEEDLNPGPAVNTLPIPQSSGGLFLQNRVFVPYERDLVAASDYLNYTRYAQRAAYRVNQGSADRLVALYKLGNASVVCFKEGSVYLANNVTGDLSGMTLEELTREYGLVARKAVVGTGEDVWFLSQHGLTSVGQTLDNKARQSGERWSDPLVRTWRRINWRYIDRATMTFFDGKVYLALPLDDATVTNEAGTYTGVNNAVLVWDGVTKAWQGVHEGGNLMVRDWLQFTWGGRKRLGFVSDEGLIFIYGFTFDDQIRPGEEGEYIVPVETRLVTRGYTFAPNDASPEVRRAVSSSMKRFSRAVVVLGTWDPEYTVKLRVDGVAEEETLVSGARKDRTEYYRPFGKRWSEGNDADDHGTKWREDYSVDCSVPGGTPILLGTGVNFEQHQEAPEGRRVNVSGRYAQVVVENVRGRCEVKAVRVEGQAGRRRGGVLI